MMLYFLSAAAFSILLASAVTGYYSYRRKERAWKKYFFFYTVGMLLFQGALFFIFISDGINSDVRTPLVLTAELFRFVVTGVVLYAFPVCILTAIDRDPNAKIKLLLIVLSGSVLIFGTIVLIWRKEGLSRAARHFFYLYLIVFSCIAIARSRMFLRNRRKRALLVLLFVSVPYFLWSISARVLFHAENAYVHIAYTGFWGCLLFCNDLRFLRSGGTLAEMRRNELFEKAELSREEREIVEMMEQGMSNREIGNYLDVDGKSLETYIYSIYKKFAVNNRIELCKKLGGSL